jgi:uncharacterized protein YlaI
VVRNIWSIHAWHLNRSPAADSRIRLFDADEEPHKCVGHQDVGFVDNGVAILCIANIGDWTVGRCDDCSFIDSDVHDRQLGTVAFPTEFNYERGNTIIQGFVLWEVGLPNHVTYRSSQPVGFSCSPRSSGRSHRHCLKLRRCRISTSPGQPDQSRWQHKSAALRRRPILTFCIQDCDFSLAIKEKNHTCHAYIKRNKWSTHLSNQRDRKPSG